MSNLQSEFSLDIIADPPMEACPIMPLGYFDGYVVFRMPDNWIRIATTEYVEEQIWLDLFNWPGYDEFQKYWMSADGRPCTLAAAIWLIRLCREAGQFDESECRYMVEQQEVRPVI